MLLTVTACALAAFGAFIVAMLKLWDNNRLAAFGSLFLAGCLVALPAMVAAGLWPNAREGWFWTAAAILGVALGLALLIAGTADTGWQSVISP